MNCNHVRKIRKVLLSKKVAAAPRDVPDEACDAVEEDTDGDGFSEGGDTTTPMTVLMRTVMTKPVKPGMWVGVFEIKKTFCNFLFFVKFWF